MKIVRVEYSRLKSFGIYENERIGYVAEVDESESPHDVLYELKQKVNFDLGLHEVKSDIKHDIDCLRRDRDDLAQEVKAMQEKYDAAKAFLEKHNVSLPQMDIPF